MKPTEQTTDFELFAIEVSQQMADIQALAKANEYKLDVISAQLNTLGNYVAMSLQEEREKRAMKVQGAVDTALLVIQSLRNPQLLQEARMLFQDVVVEIGNVGQKQTGPHKPSGK